MVSMFDVDTTYVREKLNKPLVDNIIKLHFVLSYHL